MTSARPAARTGAHPSGRRGGEGQRWWSHASRLSPGAGLEARGVRTTLDDNVEQSFGWRATEWDLQGVPIRVELGPRDLAENAAVLYRRDTRDKARVRIDCVGTRCSC